MAACSCHGQGRADSKAGQTAGDTLQGDVCELPLPEVSSMLTVLEERAEYIIGHFWDGMDFADTLRSHDRLFMERKLRELPLALPTSKAGGTVSPYRMAVEAWQWRIPWHSTLSMTSRNGISTTPIRPCFARNTTSSYSKSCFISSCRKQTASALSTDFIYTDRNGNRRTLHGTRRKRLLLLFYD